MSNKYACKKTVYSLEVPDEKIAHCEIVHHADRISGEKNAVDC